MDKIQSKDGQQTINVWTTHRKKDGQQTVNRWKIEEQTDRIWTRDIQQMDNRESLDGQTQTIADNRQIIDEHQTDDTWTTYIQQMDNRHTIDI